MSGSPQYEVVYNVGLLDDIHNYFPALLYQSASITSISQVFNYVRNQMNARFNLYNYGARLANMSMPSGPSAPQMQPIPMPIPMQMPRPGTAHSAAHGAAQRAANSQNIENIHAASALLNLLNLGFGETIGFEAAGGGDPWASFQQPVVVAPSIRAIEDASELLSGSTLTERTICTVCQDSMSVTDSIRRLTACGHAYHHVCIDQWFRGSVFCPTCRHDIRIPSLAHAADNETGQLPNADSESHSP